MAGLAWGQAGYMAVLGGYMKLSKAQERAKSKLTSEWRSAYEIGESLSTLNALSRMGLAHKKTDRLGAMYSPRTANHFKAK